MTRNVFHFGFHARTSRGAMSDKTSWFVKIWDDRETEHVGIGECGPLPGLSIDDMPSYENRLSNILSHLQEYQDISRAINDLSDFVSPELPSIMFGIETALLDLKHGGERIIFRNEFVNGSPIDINGLIWMGDAEFMRKQINEKIAQGYTCLKLKVGALDFDTECKVIAEIRNQFDNNVTIRLDANGSFRSDQAMSRLEAFSRYNIHSIEQPLTAGDPTLASVCKNSPIPIALDEELIPHTNEVSRSDLLKEVKPQYIILKPSLHGGLKGCSRWIRLAEGMGIGWWITSALESNIGLNAICQFAANYDLTLPQGLGTGSIYTNTVESPLTVRHGQIMWEVGKKWAEV